MLFLNFDRGVGLLVFVLRPVHRADQVRFLGWLGRRLSITWECNRSLGLLSRWWSSLTLEIEQKYFSHVNTKPLPCTTKNLSLSVCLSLSLSHTHTHTHTHVHTHIHTHTRTHKYTTQSRKNNKPTSLSPASSCCHDLALYKAFDGDWKVTQALHRFSLNRQNTVWSSLEKHYQYFLKIGTLLYNRAWLTKTLRMLHNRARIFKNINKLLSRK